MHVVDNTGGGGKRPGRPPGSTRFKPHKLADVLFKALSPDGLGTIQAVAARMSELAGEEVTRQKAMETIAHTRKYAYGYEWTIPMVQKGGNSNKSRKYLVAMLDANDPGFVVVGDTTGHVASVHLGAVSTLRNMLSEAKHSQASLEMFSGALYLTQDTQRKFKTLAAAQAIVGEMAKQALDQLTASR